jgi:hypothetical protein
MRQDLVDATAGHYISAKKEFHVPVSPPAYDLNDMPASTVARKMFETLLRKAP